MISQYQHKKLLVLIFVIFLVAPLVIGFEFDNVKQYDKETKTATIKNAFGFGDTIATAKLETPDMVYVQPGNNRLVAVITINNLDGDYDNFLSQMNFYNDLGSRLEYRTQLEGLNYKQYVITGSKNVEHYEWVCDSKDQFKPDKNKIQSCTYTNTGSHSEPVGEWVSFDKEKTLTSGYITIGIFVDVKPTDTRVEWIPTLFGKEIGEWAGFGVAVIDSHAQASASDGLRIVVEGVRLKTKSNLTITEVGRAGGSSGTAPTALILDASKQTIATSNFSSVTSKASFPEGMVNITNGTVFYVAAGFYQNGAWTGSYNVYRSTGLTFELTGTNVNWTGGLSDWESNVTIGTDQTTQLVGISNITTKIEIPIAATPSTISITPTFPTNNTISINSSFNFNATFVPTNINLTNASLYFSYANTTLFSQANSTLTNAGNFTSETVSNIPLGIFHWTYGVCGINDSSSHLCFFPSEKNFTFTRSPFSTDNSYYINVSYETSKDTFQANISTGAGISVVSANLIYNGTSYVADVSTISATQYSLTKEIDLPLITNNTATQNMDFKFNFAYLSGATLTTGNTTTYTHRVDQVNASLLTVGGYTIPFINFTAYDQNTLAQINATLSGTFDFGLNNTGKKFAYSHTSEDFTNYTFAFSPSNKSFLASGSFEFGKGNYEVQGYNLLEQRLYNLSDGFTNIPIYMLESGNSTTFTILVRDSTLTPVEGANVKVQRYYPATGTYLTVESVNTNADGKALGHFIVEDVTYRFLVYVGGILKLTSTPTQIICETTPCTITLTLPSASGGDVVPIGNISSFSSSLHYDKVSQTFTYTYVDLADDTLGGRLHVRRLANSGDIVVCSNNDTASASVITCDTSLQTNGTYVATAWLHRTSSGGRVVDLLMIQKARDIVGTLGNDGILISVFLFMGIIMLGLAKPIIGLVFGLFGIIAIWMLGLLELPMLSLFSIVAIAIILAWEMRK